LAFAIIALLSVGAAPSLAASACTVNQQQGRLCLAVSDTPDPVKASSANQSSFIMYSTRVSNESKSSSLSHVQLSESLPGGTTLVRVATAGGTCSQSDSVSCSFGSLKKGQAATVNVLVTAPSEAGPITLSATAGFDERFSDQAGGKADTVALKEGTDVSDTATASGFVGRGASGNFGTGSAGLQNANTSIPNASTDVFATLQVEGPDDFCTNGRVTLQGQTDVCRGGGFVNSSIVSFGGGALPLYENFQNPPVYHLQWASSLVPSFQTRHNFVVFNQPDQGSPVEVISTRCNRTNSNPPCLKNINEDSDGGWSVDLVKPVDNRMR
jgi:hypothetical protein